MRDRLFHVAIEGFPELFSLFLSTGYEAASKCGANRANLLRQNGSI
jgi:hypothetical protein